MKGIPDQELNCHLLLPLFELIINSLPTGKEAVIKGLSKKNQQWP